MGGRQSYLGEFEQVVMLAVARLKHDASGMRLRAEIAGRIGRSVSIGAIYSTLDRLVAKAYFSAREDSSDGRARRFFSLTPDGVDALEAARALQRHMWDGVQLRKNGATFVKPPAAARQVFAWLLPESDRRVILANLDEEFERAIVPVRSRLSARVWYWRQVMTSVPGAAKLRLRSSLTDIGRYFQYGGRLLRRNPAFAAAAILTLTLGIGATSAVLTLANAVLLRPLPFAEPDRLVAVMEIDLKRDASSGNVSWPDFLDYQTRNRTLSGLAGYTGGRLTLTEPGHSPVRVPVSMVTADFFAVLDVRPAVGRALDAGDMTEGAAPVAVITHRSWLSRFGGDPQIVGRSLILGGRPTQVVGLLPEQFEFTPRGTPELFLPIRPSKAQIERKFFHWFDAFGRMRPGVTLAQANDDLNRIAHEFATEDPRAHANSAIRSPRFRDFVVGDSKTMLRLLSAAAVLVLLVACANIAGLLLARSASRNAEMTVRTAMGAGRVRLFRQLVAESVVLAAPGGVLGLAVGQWMMTALLASMSPAQRVRLPFLSTLSLDAGAVAISAALTLASVVLFGVAPAWRAARREHLGALRGVVGGAGRDLRLQATFVAAQVALALVLLIGAGLLIQSVRRLLDVSPGFDTSRLLTMSLSLPADRYRTPAESRIFHDQLLDQLRALPGVSAASSVDQLPLSGAGNSGVLTVRGDASARETTTLLRTVDRRYFAAMRIPIIEGRAFGDDDLPDGTRVVIVNASLADAAFGGRPLGQRITFPFTPGVDFEVVGVVGDELYDSIDRSARPVLYFPYAQSASNFFSVAVRTTGDPAAIAPSVRAEITRMEAGLPSVTPMTMEQIVNGTEAVFRRRSMLTLLGSFAAAALFLAVIGLYGVLAQGVAQRSREIGVRLALGAPRSSIVASVVRRGFVAVAAGLVVGLGASVALGQTVDSLLFATRSSDPATFAAVIAVLTLAASVACVVPARRALGIDPAKALRNN